MKDYLLDTSAFSAYRRGHAEIATTVRAAHSAALNVVVLGELLFGFRTGARLATNLSDLERLRTVPRFRVLPVDEETADCYARLALELRRAGSPIPTNDIWIGATALQHGLEILTTDRHFTRLPLLAVRCFDPA